MKPSHTTINNYKAMLATSEGVSICSSTISKTNTRYTAENSLISSMALICTVAASHFDVSTDINLSEPKNISKATDGAQKLYKMVFDTVGKNVPVMVVKPEYVLTTDDTVQFIFDGKR